VEKADGSTEFFAESINRKSTYAYQVELCRKTLKAHLEKNLTLFSKEHGIDMSIYLLEFMDSMKLNANK